MHKLARQMAKDSRGINRHLKSALIAAFEDQPYELFELETQVTSPKTGKTERRSEEMFVLMPPDYSLGEVLKDGNGHILSLIHDTWEEFDHFVPLEKPQHTKMIVLFRGDDGELYVPLKEDFLPYKMSGEALLKIEGTVGKNLKKAYYEGIKDRNKRNRGSAPVLREKARRSDKASDLYDLQQKEVYTGNVRSLKPRRKERAAPAAAGEHTAQIYHIGTAIAATKTANTATRPTRRRKSAGEPVATDGAAKLYADRARYRIILDNAERKSAKTMESVQYAEKTKKEIEAAIRQLEETIRKHQLLGLRFAQEMQKMQTRLSLKRAALEKAGKRVEQEWQAAFKADKRELSARTQLSAIEAQLGLQKAVKDLAPEADEKPAEAQLSDKQIVQLRARCKVQASLAGEMKKLVSRKEEESARLEKAAAALAVKIEEFGKAEHPNQKDLRATRYAMAQNRAKAAQIREQADEIKARADFVTDRMWKTVKRLGPHWKLVSPALPPGLTESEVKKIAEAAGKQEAKMINLWSAAKSEQTRVRNGEERRKKQAAARQKRKELKEQQKRQARITGQPALPRARTEQRRDRAAKTPVNKRRHPPEQRMLLRAATAELTRRTGNTARPQEFSPPRLWCDKQLKSGRPQAQPLHS